MAQVSKTVSHYGIHYDRAGFPVLVQGWPKQQNALDFRPDTDFLVDLPREARNCTHMIHLASPTPNDEWRWFQDFVEHPLARFFLPVPRTDDKVLWLTDAYGEMDVLIHNLLRMSSPSGQLFLPADKPETWETARHRMMSSNIQTVVVHGVDDWNLPDAARLTAEADNLPGRLLLVGKVTKPKVSVFDHVEQLIASRLLYRYEGAYQIIPKPLEQLAARLLKGWMRGTGYASKRARAA